MAARYAGSFLGPAAGWEAAACPSTLLALLVEGWASCGGGPAIGALCPAQGKTMWCWCAVKPLAASKRCLLLRATGGAVLSLGPGAASASVLTMPCRPPCSTNGERAMPVVAPCMCCGWAPLMGACVAAGRYAVTEARRCDRVLPAPLEGL